MITKGNRANVIADVGDDACYFVPEHCRHGETQVRTRQSQI
jgi:hypothetical protein